MTAPADLDKPHRRRNLLSGEWVLVSPQRTQRPWQGHEESGAAAAPIHDENCYLCPGNARAGGAVNPHYDDVYVFPNDFPALLPDATVTPRSEGLFTHESVRGCCKVICYGPRHDLALHRMRQPAMLRVIKAWLHESATLAADYEWVQIFENRGALMGASSPHPHGQIWAIDALPTEPAKEAATQAAHFAATGNKLLLDYLAAELEADERIIHANGDWAALVPYWATWPFEALILPRRSVARLHELTESEQQSLADFLKGLLNKYDNLFNAPMSYSLGWHSAPSSRGAGAAWQLHAHIYPPALRSASIPKFMVGFELLAEKQRDITPEAAASRLRDLPANT